MSRNPGGTRFGESSSYHDFYKGTFDPNDFCKEQTDYLAKHSEVTTLAALFVSRMVQRNTLSRHSTLKEAGLFFTRSIDILDEEIKQEQKRVEKPEFSPRATANEETINKDSFRPKREDLQNETFPESKPAHEVSVESLYSDFVSESTSSSTMPREEVPEPPKLTLTELIYQLVLNILDNSINTLYAAREREIVYDEAHLSLMRSIQTVVETKWNPIINDFQELLETMLDDVRRLTLQRHLLKLRAIDKVPIKAQRLRNNYRGEVNQPPSKKEILDTIMERKCSFNRYPKDAFGVYISSVNENSSSVTSEISEQE